MPVYPGALTRRFTAHRENNHSRECMVRRATARGKFGREDKSAQMYSAFGWRVVLLARMRCARVCPFKRDGRWRPFSSAGLGHAVVTVLSSLLALCRPRGRAFVVEVRESGSAKRFQAEGVFSALLMLAWPLAGSRYR
jgi:hypothetical protein